MTPPDQDLHVTTHGATDLLELRPPLLDVYAEVYADRLADPFFSLPRYWERVEAYASRNGFGVAMGRLDGEVIGYAMGFTLPEGSLWWRGLVEKVDPALLVEDGRRTFAISEIMVRAPWRRLGHARALHDALLRERTEERATLLVLPDNAPAQAAYRSWGWRRVGGVKPFDDSPTYDAMLLELTVKRHQPRGG